ncbi:MAG: SufE family protein [Pirellulaceae bacterium]
MNALNFPPSLQELTSEFEDMFDWDERYDYLIDLGKQLPSLSDTEQSDENLVRGCMSTVWLVTDVDAQDHMRIRADSDSLIVKGLIVVLLAIFDNRKPAEIAVTDEMEVFRKLGMDQHLSPQRRNGLFAMVKRVKQLAIEHSAK